MTLKGGTTCLKCGARKNNMRFFSVAEELIAVCSDCWRKMKKPERRAFLRSFEKVKEEDTDKEEMKNGNGK